MDCVLPVEVFRLTKSSTVFPPTMDYSVENLLRKRCRGAHSAKVVGVLGVWITAIIKICVYFPTCAFTGAEKSREWDLINDGRWSRAMRGQDGIMALNGQSMWASPPHDRRAMRL